MSPTTDKMVPSETLIKILRCKEDPPVIARWSKRDGLGVFTVRDVPKGDPLCYYDGTDTKAPSVDPKTFMYSRDWEPAWIMPETNDDNNEAKSQMQHIRRIGFAEPRTAWGCAQLINDACMPDLGRIHLEAQSAVPSVRIKYVDLIAECQHYERKSAAAANVVVLPFRVLAHWFFASRDLKKGEELVTTYGIRFWQRWFLTCEEEAIRLSSALLLDPNPFHDGNMSDDELMKLLVALKFTKPFENFAKVLARHNVPRENPTKFEVFTLMVQNLYDFTLTK